MRPKFPGRAFSIEELLQYLEAHGMKIEDRPRAVRLLQNVSYSRLKSYFAVLMTDRETGMFIKGSTFEEAYALYGFDRRFRELVFHELEKIEISIRTKMGFAYSKEENGLWYTKPEYFIDKKKHAMILRRLESDMDRTDSDVITRFRQKYSDKYPPCWFALEATTIGTLSMMYDCMMPGEFKRKMSKSFGVTDVVFASWLHHIVYIRNLCAHHSRLWNKTLSITAKIPDSPAYYFPPLTQADMTKVYSTLCIIRYLQLTIKPEGAFSLRLQSLISMFPVVDVAKMGFPKDWAKDRLWYDERLGKPWVQKIYTLMSEKELSKIEDPIALI